ncbi:GNAT family N-acetyltransferase [Leifsonia sp. AG29]|uniref:GNAT family N-acetyltransferase n=1 Tax=Leifsonia sp. AG29 TaxID=2598860 RepID=UPI00131A92AF|nr:N-acetyltransferase [Leifsonia sp. AG29]
MTWSIRAGGDADVPACVELWVSAVEARDGSAPEGTAGRARSKFAQRWVSFAVAVADEGDSGRSAGTVGFALVTETGNGFPSDPPGAAYLGMVAAAPGFARSGVGGALLDAVSSQALAGHPSLVLHVLTSNTAALRLYENRGWRRHGEIFAHPLSGADTITMVLDGADEGRATGGPRPAPEDGRAA